MGAASNLATCSPLLPEMLVEESCDLGECFRAKISAAAGAIFNHDALPHGFADMLGGEARGDVHQTAGSHNEETDVASDSPAPRQSVHRTSPPLRLPKWCLHNAANLPSLPPGKGTIATTYHFGRTSPGGSCGGVGSGINSGIVPSTTGWMTPFTSRTCDM